LNGVSVNANFIVSNDFTMQDSLPNDQFLQLQYWLTGAESFSEIFTLDTTSDIMVERREDLVDTVSWTYRTFYMVFQYRIADSSSVLTTDLAGAYYDVPLGERTTFTQTTVEVLAINCESVHTEALAAMSTVDMLQLQIVAGLDNNRVLESSSEEFTFVLQSGDGF
jgi:hypothetical protein